MIFVVLWWGGRAALRRPGPQHSKTTEGIFSFVVRRLAAGTGWPDDLFGECFRLNESVAENLDGQHRPAA
jgi:hypothetical protein